MLPPRLEVVHRCGLPAQHAFAERGTIGPVNHEGAQLDAAQLVKGARYAARLTQTALATRAGVSRGTVAAVETGARSPSLDMLTGLLAAAGKQMKIELEPLDDDIRQALLAGAGDTSAADDLSMTVSLMEGLVNLDYRFEGLAAAAVLGAPIPSASRCLRAMRRCRGWRGSSAPELRVQPLHEIETTDKEAARVLRLLREQTQDTRG